MPVPGVCREGRTTGVPYEHFIEMDSLVAMHINGEPLPSGHGHPLRLVVPSLYAWQYVEYLTELRFLTGMERGFWEIRGYNDTGDPWWGERYRSR